MCSVLPKVGSRGKMLSAYVMFLLENSKTGGETGEKAKFTWSLPVKRHKLTIEMS